MFLREVELIDRLASRRLTKTLYCIVIKFNPAFLFAEGNQIMTVGTVFT